MSTSVSQSNPTTNNMNMQLSTQGASGANSPTVTAGGNVNFSNSDPVVTQAALASMQDVVNKALTGYSATTVTAIGDAKSAQESASQTASDSLNNGNELLTQALSAQSQLAQIQATGGASLSSQSTNYLIFGAIGIVLIAFLTMFKGKRA